MFQNLYIFTIIIWIFKAQLYSKTPIRMLFNQYSIRRNYLENGFNLFTWKISNIFYIRKADYIRFHCKTSSLKSHNMIVCRFLRTIFTLHATALTSARFKQAPLKDYDDAIRSRTVSSLEIWDIYILADLILDTSQSTARNSNRYSYSVK